MHGKSAHSADEGSFPCATALKISTASSRSAPPTSFRLGVVKAYGRGARSSKATHLREPLLRLLCKTVHEVHPGFAFTSIQVNKNYASMLHVDASNLGPSLAINLGAYSGGELHIDGMGKLDVHNRWQLFDGNLPHLTCPFEGERYCAIFFSSQSYGLASADNSGYLRGPRALGPHSEAHEDWSTQNA
jgi:hypothetical protein